LTLPLDIRLTCIGVFVGLGDGAFIGKQLIEKHVVVLWGVV
jgi:hypothetical protein